MKADPNDELFVYGLLVALIAIVAVAGVIVYGDLIAEFFQGLG